MAAKPEPLEAGQPAPLFTATTHTGEVVDLAAHRGRKVAVYFYPKDNTPGCTAQACNLRDHLGLLQEHGISVIGVSPDDESSHERFTEQHELTFPLVADPERKIIEQYGVWGERKNYGKTFMGLQRTTFLIDEDGVIQHVFKRPRTAAHAEEIIGKL